MIRQIGQSVDEEVPELIRILTVLSFGGTIEIFSHK